jgi:DNA-directed RNA polymerase subunit RPC12/RpoP
MGGSLESGQAVTPGYRMTGPPQEAAMWKCRKCFADVEFAAVEPEVDNDGCYFICPDCGNRNALFNVGGGGDDDPIALTQLDS